MAKLNFPASPSNGDTHTVNGNVYTYIGDPGVWRATSFGDAPAGPAGSITIGTVTTGPAGGNASVTNVGTSTAAEFDFTIPAGATGPAGPAGPGGPPGSAGPGGPAGTITVGTVTSVPTSSPAAVTNTGTSSAAVFDFDIPKGTILKGLAKGTLRAVAPFVPFVGALGVALGVSDVAKAREEGLEGEELGIAYLVGPDLAKKYSEFKDRNLSETATIRT